MLLLNTRTAVLECGCRLAHVEYFDGVHPDACRLKLWKHPGVWSLRPAAQPRHQVDGVEMPVASVIDMSNRWCDVTRECGHVAIGRQWPKLRLSSLACQVEGVWYWWLDSYPEGMTADAGNLSCISTGYARNAAEVIRLVELEVEENTMKLLETLIS